MKIFKDSNFNEEVLKSDKVVVVDFWANWCGPCKMLGPVIEEVSKEFGDTAVFGKLDVDSNPVVTQNYKIASIPTVMVFKGGKIVDTMVGFRPKDAIKALVSKHI